MTISIQGGKRYATHLDFGPFGRISAVARDGQAWTYNPMRGLDELKGDLLTQALLGHPWAVAGDWTEYFDSVEVLRNDKLDGRPVHLVRLKKDDLPSRTYWVDAEHGDVLRVNQVMLEGPIRIPVTITQSDFEKHGGVRRAMRVEVENPESGRTVLTLRKVQTGLDLGDEWFTLTDPEAK